MQGIRVLLADDHEVVRAGYRRLLESTDDIEVVAEATDGETAYQRYLQWHPSVVVMDLTMPGSGGLDASRRILARDSAARILVFSVAGGEPFIGQEMIPFLVKRKDSADSGLIADLSPREFEVFRLRAEGKSVNAIAELLNVSPKTVGHHNTRLKQKLGASNSAELTRLAIRLGLLTP